MHCIRSCLSISIITSLLSPAISIATNLPQSIVTGQYVSIDLPISDKPERLSMDSLHSPLWRAMVIDRNIAWSIVAGNWYRWMLLTIYFLRQCLTIDTITHLLPPTISIDGYLSQIYCCRQHRSMDTFHNQLSPTIYIDRLPASSIVQAVDHCCVYCPGCAMYRVHHLHDGDLLRLR